MSSVVGAGVGAAVGLAILVAFHTFQWRRRFGKWLWPWELYRG